MRPSVHDTIFALTTGALPSAVAIVKVAGPGAFSLGERLFSPPVPRGRAMTMGTIRDVDGTPIDHGVALSFVAPHSHCGDDTIEFQVHGSHAVVKRLQEALVALGARPAERGEFTYRAITNGRMEASDVEELGDVFLAQQPADLSRIYRRRDHALAAEIGQLRDQLLRIQAILDTAVDFSDEYSAVARAATQPIQEAIQRCSVVSRRYFAFQNAVFVPKIVLAGAPNAGKSSIFNGLLNRYRAIVHEEAGTTRDVIEEEIEIAGARWKLVDTAGVRNAAGVEKDGIALGEAYLSAAQFWILVVDGTVGWTDADAELLEKYGKTPHLIVGNKVDRPQWSLPAKNAIAISALESKSLAQLAETIAMRLKTVVSEAVGPLPTATEASRLVSVEGKLEKLRDGLIAGLPPELLGEENREIIAALSQVVGEVSVDDVLDRVFHEFCIGK